MVVDQETLKKPTLATIHNPKLSTWFDKKRSCKISFVNESSLFYFSRLKEVAVLVLFTRDMLYFGEIWIVDKNKL